MAAQIKFYGGDDGAIDIDSGGSGIGFFGTGGFGSSVEVAAFQSSTYVTDGNGTTAGANLHNWKYISANSGTFGGDDTTYALSGIPNTKATLNIRFTNDTAVRVQNWKVRIYDRSSINNAASGVTTRMAELVRPVKYFGSSLSNSGPWGSGVTVWTDYPAVGSSTIYTLKNQSPGISGHNIMNTSATDYRHDSYFLISMMPQTIGSKTQVAIYSSLEYL